MYKTIDIKNRVVDMYEVDTGRDEDEIIKYLNKQMKVRFHDVAFNNSKYIFIGSPDDQASYSITVSGYKLKAPDDKQAVIIR